MFVTFLSNRKQVNSASLFIASLSFRARKQLKAKVRFSLVLERALSARCFISQGLYFLFFSAPSASVTLSSLNCTSCCAPPCFQLHLCAFVVLFPLRTDKNVWLVIIERTRAALETRRTSKHRQRRSSAYTVTTTQLERPSSDDWVLLLLNISLFIFF